MHANFYSKTLGCLGRIEPHSSHLFLVVGASGHRSCVHVRLGSTRDGLPPRPPDVCVYWLRGLSHRATARRHWARNFYAQGKTGCGLTIRSSRTRFSLLGSNLPLFHCHNSPTSRLRVGFQALTLTTSGQSRVPKSQTLLLAICFALGGCQTPAVTYDAGDAVLRTERDAVELLKLRTAALPMGDSADTPLILLRSSLPDYPEEVIADEVEGVVDIRFTIDEAGLVRNFQVISSPDERLTAECLRVLSEWRFQPVQKEGRAVKIEARQRFPFKLQG